jgi:hypothetical protein
VGLFDFFKKKTKSEPLKIVVQGNPFPSIQTPSESISVYMQPESIKAYRKTFYKELGSIPEFSKDDLDAMYRIIVDDGHLDPGQYCKPVFKQFFLNKKWTWTEYEKWLDICEKLNHFPVRWVNYPKELNYQVNFVEIIENLKVMKIKEVLAFLNMDYPAKSKKADLIKIALDVPFLEERLKGLKLIDDLYTEQRESIGYGMYYNFMLHVSFRANCLRDRMRASRLNCSYFVIFSGFKEDQEFIDLALAEDKNALTPLFPMDSSFWTFEFKESAQ